MFSGIVETVGRIVLAEQGPVLRLGVASTLPLSQMSEGESVAVDGVCLTVAERQEDRFYADVVAETLLCTTLAAASPGRRVNLERSLRLGDPLGGHFVQGHVDTTAPVVEVLRRGGDQRVRVGLPAELQHYVAHKGSVAVAGVSLTVSALGPGWFEVALVPHTVSHTTLGELTPGERVNLEVDLLARYLERLRHGTAT